MFKKVDFLFLNLVGIFKLEVKLKKNASAKFNNPLLG